MLPEGRINDRMHALKRLFSSRNERKAGQPNRILVSRIPQHSEAITGDNMMYITREDDGG